MKSKILILTFLVLLSCDEVGSDNNYPLSLERKVLFKEGDIMTYKSNRKIEKFEVVKIINGKYYDSRSGTCGKPRFNVYEPPCCCWSPDQQP